MKGYLRALVEFLAIFLGTWLVSYLLKDYDPVPPVMIMILIYLIAIRNEFGLKRFERIKKRIMAEFTYGPLNEVMQRIAKLKDEDVN